MSSPDPHTLYRTFAKLIWLAAGVFTLVWFLDTITVVLLFFVAVLIFALALNPPVRWLERRRVPRGWATVLVALGIALVTGLIAWLVVPRLGRELTTLVGQLPAFAADLADTVAEAIDDFAPQLAQNVRLRLNAETLGRLLPTLQTFITQVGTLTLSLLSGVVLLLVLLSTVIYAVAKPQPLLRGYVALFPEALRLPATRALIRSGETVSGWLWSNVIVGAIEAVLVFAVLSFLGVPGALVWGALAFFAELIPRFGFYIMAIPPVLVALTVSPLTALWVVLFFVVLNEVMGDLVAPLIRANRMDLHPVSLIFAVLALGSAFGLLGALVATPVTGIVKAFYEEFMLFRRRGAMDAEQAAEDVLDGRLEEWPGGRPPPADTHD